MATSGIAGKRSGRKVVIGDRRAALEGSNSAKCVIPTSGLSQLGLHRCIPTVVASIHVLREYSRRRDEEFLGQRKCVNRNASRVEMELLGVLTNSAYCGIMAWYRVDDQPQLRDDGGPKVCDDRNSSSQGPHSERMRTDMPECR